MARQHLVHLHSTSKVGTISDLTTANLQVGELAMYNPAAASATTIYAFNANKDALAEFKTDAYYQDIFKTKLNSSEISKYTPIGSTGDTSGTTSYYGVKKYAQQYADAKVNGLDATVTSTTTSIITSITQTNGKLASVGTSSLTLKKTAGTSSDTYVLKSGNNQIGDTITVYKDSSVKSVVLSGETLVITYLLHDGTENPVEIPLDTFLTEAEAESLAGKGLTVDKSGANPVLNIVKGGDSESFLVVNDDSIEIKGVQNAINTAKNAATSYTQTNYTQLGTTANTSTDKTYYGLKKYTDEAVAGHNSTNIVVNSGSSSYVSVSATAQGHSITLDVKDTISTNFAAKTHTHNASAITAGTIAIARIPTGTSSTTVARGDHNHDAAYLPKSQKLTVKLQSDVTGEATANLSAGTITITTTVADNSHNHTSTNITDRITAGDSIVDGATGLTDGNAVYEFVTGAITDAAYDDPLTGTTTGATGSYITIKHSVNNSKNLTTELDETKLTTALNGKAPENHATTATTYGSATTTNYGHVKLATGDLTATAATNGVAASNFHNHDARYNAKYLPITQNLKLTGDITGEATITGGVATSLSTTWKNTINSKLSTVSLTGKFGTDNGVASTTYTANTGATTFDLTMISIDCGEY